MKSPDVTGAELVALTHALPQVGRLSVTETRREGAHVYVTYTADALQRDEAERERQHLIAQGRNAPLGTNDKTSTRQ